MKVIQMQKGGGPEVLELAEKLLAEPAPDEVRVRAEAIGISSADMLVRKGVYSWMPPLPAIPGNEMAGTVDALGRDVTDLRVGQRVLVSSRELSFRGGCYAQAICVPATSVFVLPKTIAPNDAVSLPNYQLAGALLYESGVRKPRRIVAYGASGGVGMALLQLAKADGIAAIGIVSTEEKRAFVERAGIEHVLMRGQDDLRERVMPLTGGLGVDVVYAMAGPTAAFIGNLDLLAPLGTVVSFAILGGLMPDADILGELRKRIGKSLGVRSDS
ncbi:MAG: NADPH:quinone reductase, partial [Betaproteobacteria bacterium]